MLQTVVQVDTVRYAQCIEASKRIRWDIDKDVIRGRQFNFSKKFLPDGLSKVHELNFLSEAEQRLISQLQGRTHANMFGLVERFINAKILEVSRDSPLLFAIPPQRDTAATGRSRPRNAESVASTGT